MSWPAAGTWPHLHFLISRALLSFKSCVCTSSAAVVPAMLFRATMRCRVGKGSGRGGGGWGDVESMKDEPSATYFLQPIRCRLLYCIILLEASHGLDGKYTGGEYKTDVGRINRLTVAIVQVVKPC